jgi:hypothetical protein
MEVDLAGKNSMGSTSSLSDCGEYHIPSPGARVSGVPHIYINAVSIASNYNLRFSVVIPTHTEIK